MDTDDGSGLVGLLRRVLGLAQTRLFRVGFLVLAIALALWAVITRREQVEEALAELRPPLLALAALATVLNAGITGLAWRSVLTDLGSKLPLRVAARVFFVGQIGKYLPGSVWPMVMQAELAREHGVPRRRTGASTLVTLLLALTTGLMVTVVALTYVPQVAGGGYGWVLVLVVPLLVALHPRLLGLALDRLIGAIGGQPLEHPPSTRGIAVATAWTLLSWLIAGGQIWFLIGALGGPMTLRSYALSVGGYAFSWAAGMVVVFAPAGAGVREVVLMAALSSVLDPGAALVVALVSRVLFTVVDLVAAGTAHGFGPRGQALDAATAAARSGPEPR